MIELSDLLALRYFILRSSDLFSLIFYLRKTKSSLELASWYISCLLNPSITQYGLMYIRCSTMCCNIVCEGRCNDLSTFLLCHNRYHHYTLYKCYVYDSIPCTVNSFPRVVVRGFLETVHLHISTIHMYTGLNENIINQIIISERYKKEEIYNCLCLTVVDRNSFSNINIDNALWEVKNTTLNTSFPL